MNPCTNCRGKCPTPEACELPIQPSADEIRRDRLDYLKHIASYCAAIGGGILLVCATAYAIGRAYAG